MAAMLVIAILLLAAAIAAMSGMCAFYLSDYARFTGRSFLETLRNPHERMVYQVSRGMRKGLGRRRRSRMGSRMLFGVDLPLTDGRQAHADIVAFGPGGIAAVCVLEGAGELHGNERDEKWLVVPRHGQKGAGGDYLVPSPLISSLMVSGALSTYLNAGVTISPCVALAPGMDGKLVPLPDGVTGVFSRRQRRQLGAMIGEEDSFAEPAGCVADPLLSEDSLRRAYRAVKRCTAFSGAADDFGDVGWGAPAAQPAPILWAKERVDAARKERAAKDIVRWADKIAVEKENFDAFTWNKLEGIHQELSGSPDAERMADLLDEMALVIRTNMSLNYRFGIAQAGAGAPLSAAGLVMQDAVEDEPAFEAPEHMHRALEDSAFFEGGFSGGEAPFATGR